MGLLGGGLGEWLSHGQACHHPSPCWHGQQGVQIGVDTSGSDGLTFQCRLWHKTAGELLFQTPLSCTFRWEKRFFVHSSQNKKEAKLEAKIYVFQHIQTLRISSSHVDMKLYPDAKFLR